MITAEELWGAYLDAVEQAARAVERQAVETGNPVLTPLPQPQAAWPAALEPRRREVLATLAAAEETVRRCRDDTATALAALRRPTVRLRAGYGDGERLDVLG
ncbi:MAG: hypothetical protein ACXV1K_01785 [Kineosporiaceae bacterium]